MYPWHGIDWFSELIVFFVFAFNSHLVKKRREKEHAFCELQRGQTCVQINTLLIYKEAQRLTHASWQSSRQIIWITVRTHMSTAYSLQQESVVLNQEPNKSHLGLYFLTQYYQKNGLRHWLLFLWISRLCFMFHPYSQAINRVALTIGQTAW